MGKYLCLLFLSVFGITANGQTSTTIYSSGTAGTYITGNSTSSIRTDGNIVVTNGAQRGYAVFSLSGIPAGSTISSVTLGYNTATISGSSSPASILYGYAGNLSTVTVASTLFADMVAGTSLASGSALYTTSTGNKTNSLSTAFFAANIGSTISICWTTSSATRVYTITGETGSSATSGTHAPYLTIVYTAPCSSTPTAGTVSPSISTGCTTYSPLLSLTGATVAPGINYQWSSSPNNSTWTPVSGATNATYTPTISSNIYYNCQLTCTVSGLSATTAGLLLSINTNTYATLPFFESFETTWINGCNAMDWPNLNWRNTPNTGNSSWRREDDGGTVNSAGWTSPTIGTYSPAFSAGAHSARFHSYYAGLGTIGALDFYVNLGSAGTKNITYDYINASGTDNIICEVSTDGGTTFTTLDAPPSVATVWTTRAFTTTATSATAILRFLATSDYGNDDIGLDNINVTQPSACTGTPTAGTVASTLSSGCTTYSSTLSLTGSTVAGAINYQWSSSPNNSTWTPVSGATNNTYAATVTTSLYYNCQLTCTLSGLSATTAGVLLNLNSNTYATLPFTESFESLWGNGCGTMDWPNTNWKNTPSSGNPSWRREDDAGSTNSAGWTSSTSGLYSPAFSAGSHSARFHSYSTGSGTTGALDLYVNLGTSGFKIINYDYINTSGSDNIVCQVSTDGGATFTTIDAPPAIASVWTTRSSYTTATSSTAIIRFLATSDFGATDIGLDNISVSNAPICSGTPTTGTVSATVSSGCTTYSSVLTLTGFSVVNGLTFQWQSSPNNVTWTPVSGATSNSYTATVTSNIYYRCAITCTNSGLSASTSGALLSIIGSYATLPFTESFESTWINGCNTMDWPNTNWRNTPATGNSSWRREDDGGTTNSAVWTAPTTGLYSPVFSAGAHSARFHSYFATSGSTGALDLYVNMANPGLKNISYSYINPTGTDNIVCQVSTDGGVTFTSLDAPPAVSTVWSARNTSTTATSATAILRFLATSDYGNDDIGLDNVNVAYGPPVVVASPTSLAFGNIFVGASSATQTFSLSGTLLTSSPLTVTAPSGFLVSGDGTTWTSSYTISFTPATLSATTVYVQFDPSSGGAYSGNVAITGGGLSVAYNVAVTGTGLIICAGTPAAGTTTTTSAYVTGGTAFTLGFSGSSSTVGLTYQWQSSSCGAPGTFANITGRLSTLTTTEAAGTFYQCILTCTVSGLSSSSVPVYVAHATAAYCYPASTNGCSANNGVNAFTLTGACGTSLADAGPMLCGSINTDHTGYTPAILYPGASYSSTVNSKHTGDGLYIWIDFNNSGTFDAGELVYSSASSVTASPTNFSYSIPIPTIAGGATYGLHRMRVIADNGQALTTGCTTLTYGTSVDYMVQIVPNATVSSNSPLCTPVTLTLTALPSIACGATYTWSGPGSYSNTTYNANTVTPTAASGTYSVSISAYGVSSCPSPGTVTVTVNPAPSLTGGALNSGPICSGSTLTLTASGPVNVAGYSWSGPVAISSSTSAVATVPAATTTATGIYTVTVNNGAGAGCSVTYTTPATVNATPAPIADGSGPASSNYNYCLSALDKLN